MLFFAGEYFLQHAVSSRIPISEAGDHLASVKRIEGAGLDQAPPGLHSIDQKRRERACN